MTRFKSKHYMDGLLILLLFGVFAVSILAVLLSGAGAYRRLTERDDRAYDRRTATQYGSARVRQAAGEVTVVDFGGVEALELWEDIECETYVTRVYCSDGYLRELFCWEEAELAPEDGEIVLPAQEMSLNLEDGLLDVEIVSGDGETLNLTLALRSGKGAAE